MAQQRRMIYSSIFANAELNMRPVEERLLYMGTIILADDDGKLRADPRYLKGQVFPYDEKITSLEVEKWLQDLASFEQVLLYERDGIKILKHPNWAKYQHIRKDLYVKSKLPSPLRDSSEAVTSAVLNISKDNISKEDIATARVADDFSLKKAIEKMEESPRRDLNIIALYFRERKPDIQTREQCHVAIKRHLRPAKELSPFSDEQILKAIPKAKSITSDWTIETIIKVLTK